VEKVQKSAKLDKLVLDGLKNARKSNNEELQQLAHQAIDILMANSKVMETLKSLQPFVPTIYKWHCHVLLHPCLCIFARMSWICWAGVVYWYSLSNDSQYCRIIYNIIDESCMNMLDSRRRQQSLSKMQSRWYRLSKTTCLHIEVRPSSSYLWTLEYLGLLSE
jgi:hypothetical protein